MNRDDGLHEDESDVFACMLCPPLRGVHKVNNIHGESVQCARIYTGEISKNHENKFYNFIADLIYDWRKL